MFQHHKKLRKQLKENLNEQIILEYLKAENTQESVAKKFNVDDQTVANIRKTAKMQDFEFQPLLYNIWNTSKEENAIKHFGLFPEMTQKKVADKVGYDQSIFSDLIKKNMENCNSAEFHKSLNFTPSEIKAGSLSFFLFHCHTLVGYFLLSIYSIIIIDNLITTITINDTATAKL